jgi:hypothetical protein
MFKKLLSSLVKNFNKMKKYYLVAFLFTLYSIGNYSIAQPFEWAKGIGGTLNDIGHAICIDGSGNVYTAGSFKGTVDFDPGSGTVNLSSAGDDDIFISKSDALGNLMWAKKIGGGGLDHLRTMILDGSGNIYLTGDFEGTVDFDPGTATYNMVSAGMDDMFISKLDSSGSFVWAKRLGSTDQDEGFSIAIDGSGNVFTTGHYWGTVDFDPGTGSYELTAAGGYDVFILKLDATGEFSWAKSMGGADWDFAFSLTLDGSGNIYTTGYFHLTADFDPGPGTYNLTSAGNYDVFISRLDADGNFNWAARIGGTDVDYGFQVSTDAAGNVYTAGDFKGTVDFDPGSGTVSLTSEGTYDMFICKLDPSGNFAWVKTIGGTLIEYVNSMTLDAEGNIYTTGYFQGTTDFDPGSGTNNLISAGAGDIFICRLDASGNFVWVKSIGGPDNDIGVGLSLDSQEDIYLTGYFTETVDFDPGPGSYELTSAGEFDVFMLKLGNTGLTGIDESLIGTGQIAIYPNPGQGLLYVSSESIITEIKIFNAIGQCVYQLDLNKMDCELFLKEVGVYFVQITSGKDIITKRVVVQD